MPSFAPPASQFGVVKSSPKTESTRNVCTIFRQSLLVFWLCNQVSARSSMSFLVLPPPPEKGQLKRTSRRQIKPGRAMKTAQFSSRRGINRGKRRNGPTRGKKWHRKSSSWRPPQPIKVASGKTFVNVGVIFHPRERVSALFPLPSTHPPGWLEGR